jgi:hypothetical protein
MQIYWGLGRQPGGVKVDDLAVNPGTFSGAR